ncbi:MAG: hypothetical protein M1822_003424 [Bathelium mastoideum]|nr:MAG: hypothetical protein M1822_003424 [Bathelium mastoideum]
MTLTKTADSKPKHEPPATNDSQNVSRHSSEPLPHSQEALPDEAEDTIASSGDATSDPSALSPGYSTSLQTDTAERSRKKQVAWNSPEVSPKAHSAFSTAYNAASSSLRDSHSHTRFKNQGALDELRQTLKQVLTHQPDGQSAPATENEADQIVKRVFDTPSSPKLKPKSVLRSGAITPPTPASPPFDDEPCEEGSKARSALQARDKANKLEEHLNSETDDLLNASSDPAHLHFSNRASPHELHYECDENLLESGQSTPGLDRDYVPRPTRFRLGAHSAQILLDKLTRRSASSSRASSRASSPERIPLKTGHTKSKCQFFEDAPSDQSVPRVMNKIGQKLTTSTKKPSTSRVNAMIQRHLEETSMMQQYIVLLCECFMIYGAPTHRLQDYLKITSRTFKMEAHLLYLPGCMIISFDDLRAHTTQVKLVKAREEVDLSKLCDAHNIYKRVIHDEIGVAEATQQLRHIRDKPKKFKTRFLIPLYGVASATVAPWAFQGRFIDMPIAFFLGCLLAILRLLLASKSDLYTAMFEIVAVAITSFLSRAFGSINDGHLFCFSSLASSSITLILPGYRILCAALELQSGSVVAGSVRMVYALVYSLFIGFSLTIGTATYGIMDKDATSSSQCENPMPAHLAFVFVPVFTLCLMIIHQAKWTQMPLMLIIAFAGYVVSFFSEKAFSHVAAASSGMAAIVISIMANIHNRLAGRFNTYRTRIERKVAKWVLKSLCEQLGYQNCVVEPEGLGEGASAGHELNVLDPPNTHVENSSDKFRAGEMGHPPPQESGSPASSTFPERCQSQKTSGSSSPVDDRGPPQTEMPSNDPNTPKPQINYSLAAAAMLPAIFVLVPSGLSVQGSLVQGISTADQIANLTTHGSSTNGTGLVTSSQLMSGDVALQNTLAFNVGYSVIQISVGITVGLFIGTLFVYPFGKSGKWASNMRSPLGSL